MDGVPLALPAHSQGLLVQIAVVALLDPTGAVFGEQLAAVPEEVGGDATGVVDLLNQACIGMVVQGYVGAVGQGDVGQLVEVVVVVAVTGGARIIETELLAVAEAVVKTVAIDTRTGQVIDYNNSKGPKTTEAIDQSKPKDPLLNRKNPARAVCRHIISAEPHVLQGALVAGSENEFACQVVSVFI